MLSFTSFIFFIANLIILGYYAKPRTRSRTKLETARDRGRLSAHVKLSIPSNSSTEKDIAIESREGELTTEIDST